ncbi:Aste57867_19119 [Aphanomyces stellatus]|uniref:Aste57867_19119 protein n=1 Tax=Aphanomyces stellatus TaxID=120398 RepID=A0A485LC11_9STRA|nr:hypothetical protein As57867_019055 [Aphanomyces stellatus]VFT95842.1 Aste57867_19119 [Aphanomyces stellatus]
MTTAAGDSKPRSTHGCGYADLRNLWRFLAFHLLHPIFALWLLVLFITMLLFAVLSACALGIQGVVSRLCTQVRIRHTMQANDIQEKLSSIVVLHAMYVLRIRNIYYFHAPPVEPTIPEAQARRLLPLACYMSLWNPVVVALYATWGYSVSYWDKEGTFKGFSYNMLVVTLHINALQVLALVMCSVTNCTIVPFFRPPRPTTSPRDMPEGATTSELMRHDEASMDDALFVFPVPSAPFVAENDGWTAQVDPAVAAGTHQIYLPRITIQS